MNYEVAQAGLALLEQGGDFALLTIIDTHGSSPRHSGAAMLVKADGSFVGTIGGGPLEADCIGRAVEALKTHRHSLVQFDSAELGMACGGGGQVLVEYVEAGGQAAKQVFGAVLRLWREGRRGWLLTTVPREQDLGAPVTRCLVDSEGRVTDHAADLHVQAVGADGKAYVFGAGHCGHSLVRILSGVGFYTVIIDDRPQFASAERFPTAGHIEVPPSFEGVVATLDVDQDSYLVIVTRGHAHDKTVLAQALRTPAAYIGVIGSRRKIAETYRLLGEEGFSAEDLARVHAPIGLSIGAETPEEIAVSIAAELIQVRSAKQAESGVGGPSS